MAIHKAIPLGLVPLEGYRVDDIDRAARDFPGLSFEVVHGGMAFLEETAFQLARFPNVYVNLELTTALLGRRPRAFANALATMVHLGGPFAYERILWGTGVMGVHPQQYIELFLPEFEYPQDILELTGIPQITLETKRQILGENYARMVESTAVATTPRSRTSCLGRSCSHGVVADATPPGEFSALGLLVPAALYHWTMLCISRYSIVAGFVGESGLRASGGDLLAPGLCRLAGESRSRQRGCCRRHQRRPYETRLLPVGCR